MWINLSYPSKTTLALAGRLSLYSGGVDLEAVHIAISALEVGANAWSVALRSSSREALATTLNEYLEGVRDLRQDYPNQNLATSARLALDSAHEAKRQERFLDRFRHLASWRALSTDQLVLGCIRTDETSRALLARAGLSETGFAAAMAELPSESRHKEPVLNRLLELDPDDWLFRTES